MAGDTQARIAQCAMELFSRSGFEAVSIRDICRAAGVRESTIYYHFTNKQAILQALLNRVDAIIGEKQARFEAALAHMSDFTREEFCFVAQHLLSDYFMHPQVLPLIRMLSMERVSDEAADLKFRQIVFELPKAYQSTVFKRMAEGKRIRPCDSDTLAEIYNSIVAAAFLQHCLSAQTTDGLTKAYGQLERSMGALYDSIRL